MKTPYIMKLAIHHECWSNPTERAPDVSLTALGVGYENDTAYGLIKMAGDKEQKKKLYEMIRRHKYTVEIKKKSKNWFFLRVKKETSMYAGLSENNFLLENKIPIRDGIEVETIFGFTKKSLMESLSRIRENAEAKKITITPVENTELTQKEQGLLDLAIRRGYYEVPRKIYALDLAKELGLGKSVVTDRLRRIEKKLITQFV